MRRHPQTLWQRFLHGQVHYANVASWIDLPELIKFADNLEKACIDTIESGKMTKDLALITELENPVVLNSLDFIKAIRETLEKMYA